MKARARARDNALIAKCFGRILRTFASAFIRLLTRSRTRARVYATFFCYSRAPQSNGGGHVVDAGAVLLDAGARAQRFVARLFLRAQTASTRARARAPPFNRTRVHMTADHRQSAAATTAVFVFLF